MVERRKYKRYRVQEGTIAVFRPSPSLLGQIENISLGGMRVRYIDEEKPATGFTDLTLLKIGEHDLISHLPFSLVLDREYDKPLPNTTMPLRRSHIKFEQLTPKQHNAVREFIRLYGRPSLAS